MTRGFALLDDIYSRVYSFNDGAELDRYYEYVDFDEALINALFSRPVVGLLYEATYHAVSTLASLDARLRSNALAVRERYVRLGTTSNVLGNMLTFDSNGDRSSIDYAFFDIGADDVNSTHVVWRSNAVVTIDSDIEAPSTWLRSSIDQYFVLRDNRNIDDTRPLCVEFFVVKYYYYSIYFSILKEIKYIIYRLVMLMNLHCCQISILPWLRRVCVANRRHRTCEQRR